MHVMVGQDATFSCGGEALAILWFINDQNIDDLGIKDVFNKVEDFRISNITVSGVVEYHNASIQCVLYLSTPTGTVNSLSPVLLTVFGKLSHLLSIDRVHVRTSIYTHVHICVFICNLWLKN